MEVLSDRNLPSQVYLCQLSMFNFESEYSADYTEGLFIYLCFCRLAYLHEDVEPQILHGRLRSSCILLDQHWNPKIANFGLVELLPLEYSPGPLGGEMLVVSSKANLRVILKIIFDN